MLTRANFPAKPHQGISYSNAFVSAMNINLFDQLALGEDRLKSIGNHCTSRLTNSCPIKFSGKLPRSYETKKSTNFTTTLAYFTSSGSSSLQKKSNLVEMF